MTLRPIAFAAGLALAACGIAPPSSPPSVLAIRPGPPPPPMAGEVLVVPGAMVGPIRLGMRRDEVEALGVLRRHARYTQMTTPYQVGYDDAGRVEIVMVSLLSAPAAVRVGAVTLPRGTRFHEARALLGDCSEPEIGFGGGTFTCRGGLIEVSGGSGAPDEIWIGTHPAR
jgi:hypothetical protein